MKGLLRGWRRALAATAVVVAGGVGLTVSDGTPATAAPDTTFVYAGSGSAGIAIELFLPSSVAVNKGDTVEFVNPYEEPHTVTYTDAGPIEGEFEPFNVEAAASFDGSESFNSGLMGKDATFAVTFEETGLYTLLCLLHPGMTVDVAVLAEGQSIPPMGGNSPAVKRTIEEGLALGEAASADALAAVKAENAGATGTWFVDSGPSVPFKGATVDVMRFLEPEISIPTGGEVTWRNPTGVPHTVTFFNGPPPEDFDPFVPVNTDNTTYDASEFYNAMISAAPVFGGITEVSLKFDKAGTYNYVCVLHADQGMVGVINVGGATGGGGITPPSTGDAGLLEKSSGSWMMLGGVAMLLGSLAAGAVVAVRKDV